MLLYADIQVGKFSLFDQQSMSGYGLRLDNIIQACEWVANEIRQRKPTIVVNLGDIFDPIGILDSDSLSAGSKCIAIVQEACDEVGAEHIMLVGNHDYGYVSRKVTSIDHFGFLTKIKVIRDSSTFMFGNKLILAIPYLSDQTHIQNSFNGAMAAGCRLAVTHLDYRGARFNAKMQSDYGANSSDFSQMNIINGHYHISQSLGNLICPGSLIQHKYSEYCPVRYIVEVEEDLKINLIPNTISPVIFKTTNLDELRDVQDNAYVWVDYDPVVYDEEFIKTTCSRFKKSLVTKSIRSNSTLKASKRLEAIDDIDQFNEYVDNILATTLDKNVLKEKGTKIVNECKIN
jgi:hypothetical protein